MPAPAYTICLATPADAPLIARHRALMFVEMGFLPAAHSERMQTESIGYLQRAMPTGQYVHFLMHTTAEPAALVAGGGLRIVDEMPWVREDGSVSSTPHAMVMNVYTESTHRHLGLARQVMLHIHAYCAQQGLGRVLLRASQAGRPLYEQLGYKATNEMRLSEAQMP